LPALDPIQVIDLVLLQRVSVLIEGRKESGAMSPLQAGGGRRRGMALVFDLKTLSSPLLALPGCGPETKSESQLIYEQFKLFDGEQK
jgi:hypothetical protein